MIRLLVLLHPRAWRTVYGEEFAALLKTAPLTPWLVADVVRNALRQHLRVHAIAFPLLAAVLLSAVVEVLAVHADVTANILWPPSDPLRALALLALLVPWVPLVRELADAVRRRRSELALDRVH